jgi:hypothetical protein
MKKRKQAKVRKKNPTLWIIGLVAIVVLIGGYIWMNYDWTETKPAETTAPTPPSVVTPVSELLLDETVQLTKSPFVKTVNLEMGRYDVSFEADKRIRFVLYSETRYNEWIDSGEHTQSKISTQDSSECCAISGNYRIDINEGEAGTYYFVFEDVRDLGMSSSKIVINKIGELGR